MKIPTIHGIIERRMLVNYIAEPNVVERILPKPFRPKLFEGKAIVGICLIRLKNIKPKGFPNFVGVNSENGAHRIAVEWEENGEIRSEEHTSELQSRPHLVCRLLLEKKNIMRIARH